MNKRAIITACIMAALVGILVPGPWDNQAQHPVVAHTHHANSSIVVSVMPEQRCTAIIVVNNWRAGDLCDTLPPAINLSESRWRRYNRTNGWLWIGRNPYHDPNHLSGDCWYTGEATDVPWILCWDGTIMRST